MDIHHPHSPWTGERVEQLTRLWAEGYSATQIAATIGVGRNAVIGKIHRLKLPAPEVKREHPRGRRPKIPHTPQRQAYLRQLDQIRCDRYRLKQKKAVRIMFAANGASRTSVAYRKHLPIMPEMSKSELRAMLTEAVRNT